MRDLIVIGAGLAGSSLAAAMARRGWDVLLVERKELPRHRVCGEFLSPEARQSLEAMGLDSPVTRLGPWPMTEARLVAISGRTLTLPLPGPAWGVSRYRLDWALTEAAREAGAEVQLGVSASHIAPLSGGGYAVAVGGAKLTARAAVAAWGRQTLPGLRAHQPPPRQASWVGIKRHYTGLNPGQAVELYLIEGGYVGLAPVEGFRLNCAALVTQDRFRRAGGGIQPFLEHACRQNPALAERLAGGRPVPESEVTASGLDPAQRPVPWTLLPLLGDSSAMIPPLSGDGMAMALRSAELTVALAEAHLQGRLSRAEWAARFTRAYHTEFSRRLRVARLLQGGLVHPVAGEWLLSAGRLLPSVAGKLLLATRGPVHPPSLTT